MKLIGISGKAGSGKDLFVSILKESVPYLEHRKMAGYLKHLCREHFGLTLEQTDGAKKGEHDSRYCMTPRQIMIDTGRFYRSIDPHFWIKKLHVDIEQIWAAKNNVPVAISDIRFPNEADWVRAMGGVLVRLERSAELRGGDIDDESETSLDNYKYFDFTFNAASNVNAADMRRNVQVFLTGVLSA